LRTYTHEENKMVVGAGQKGNGVKHLVPADVEEDQQEGVEDCGPHGHEGRQVGPAAVAENAQEEAVGEAAQSERSKQKDEQPQLELLLVLAWWTQQLGQSCAGSSMLWRRRRRRWAR